MYSLLAERSIIKITGEDKFKFLQGLLSNDLNKLEPNQALYACMLTPQSKYFADFFLYSHQASILLDVPALRQEEILKKLNLYKLRSAIALTPCPEYKIVAFLAEQDISLLNEIIFNDPRSTKLGMRGFIPESNLEEVTKNLTHDQNAYDQARIANFIAEGEKDLIPGHSFLLEYGLDKLNAIDYKKGCYVGQELVARTHYRGTIRKEIVRVEGENNLPELGTVIYAGEIKLGIICSSVHNKALALIRSEEAKNLAYNTEILVDGQKIKLIFQEEKE